MLRLLLSKAQGRNPSKPCHVGIHWVALALLDEYPCARVSVIVFLHHFVMAKLATSSMRVNPFTYIGPEMTIFNISYCSEHILKHIFKKNGRSDANIQLSIKYFKSLHLI